MQDGSDFDIDIDNIDLDAIPIVLTTHAKRKLSHLGSRHRMMQHVRKILLHGQWEMTPNGLCRRLLDEAIGVTFKDGKLIVTTAYQVVLRGVLRRMSAESALLPKPGRAERIRAIRLEQRYRSRDRRFKRPKRLKRPKCYKSKRFRPKDWDIELS